MSVELSTIHQEPGFCTGGGSPYNTQPGYGQSLYGQGQQAAYTPTPMRVSTHSLYQQLQQQQKQQPSRQETQHQQQQAGDTPSPVSHDICTNKSTELPPPPPLTPPPPKERFSYTRYQLEVLAGIYGSVRYPNAAQKHLIAKRVGITRDQVKIWFQNRRRKDVIGPQSGKSKPGTAQVEKKGPPMVPDTIMKGVVAELLRYAEDSRQQNKKPKGAGATKGAAPHRTGPYNRPTGGADNGKSAQKCITADPLSPLVQQLEPLTHSPTHTDPQLQSRPQPQLHLQSHSHLQPQSYSHSHPQLQPHPHPPSQPQPLSNLAVSPREVSQQTISHNGNSSDHNTTTFSPIPTHLTPSRDQNATTFTPIPPHLTSSPSGGAQFTGTNGDTNEVPQMMQVPSNEQLDMVAPPNAIAPGAPSSSPGALSGAESPRSETSEEDEEKSSQSSQGRVRADNSPVISSGDAPPPNVTLQESEPLPDMDRLDRDLNQHDLHRRNMSVAAASSKIEYHHPGLGGSGVQQRHHPHNLQGLYNGPSNQHSPGHYHHGYRSHGSGPHHGANTGGPSIHAPIPSYAPVQSSWLADRHQQQAGTLDSSPYSTKPEYHHHHPGLVAGLQQGSTPPYPPHVSPPALGHPHPHQYPVPGHSPAHLGAFKPDFGPLAGLDPRVLPFSLVADPPLRLSSMHTTPTYSGDLYSQMYKHSSPHTIYRDPYQPLLISSFTNPYLGLDPSAWQSASDRNAYPNL